MIKFSQILKEQTDNLLTRIVSIFERVLEKYSSFYEIKSVFEDGWCKVKFLKKGHKYGPMGAESSISFMIDGDKNLHLLDVYVPNDMKGKGYLTEVLSQVRGIKELSGKCRVHVGMNREGWKTILRRAGFEWIIPETDVVK